MRRRRAFRGLDRAIDRVKEEIQNCKRERDQAWKDARGYLQAGQKRSAQHCLLDYRAHETDLADLDKKRWFFERVCRKFRLAQTDLELVGALKGLMGEIKIDPDHIDETIERLLMTFEDKQEAQKIIESAIRQDEATVEGDVWEIPSLAEMEQQLDQEVAAEMRGKTPGTLETEVQDSKQAAIGAGRMRLKDLLEGDK